MDVSIVIPTLNEEKYLPRCLDAISRQEFNGSYEVIIGDGGSHDRTEKVALEYSAKFVVEKKPTISAGRQKACELAKGRIIVSTDADAVARADWLAKLVESIDRGNVGVYGLVEPYEGSWLERKVFGAAMLAYMGSMRVLGDDVPVGSNFAFKHKEFNKIGGFNTDLVTGEDLDLVKRLKREGNVSFNPNTIVCVSMRRVKEWGYLRFIKFHLQNAFRFHRTGKSVKSYKPVR
ncbi:MAG: glycosyltransferase [Candidatus Diapherotrites archaeon]|nr:glycosyltransferase [Candidatus Diapherotrites archaeon]